MKQNLFLTLFLTAGMCVFVLNGKAETLLADFGTNQGVNPPFSNNGGCNSLAIANNPDKTGINTSNKVLYAVTHSSSQEWWKGVEINIQDFVVSTSTARYLHIMMFTNSGKFEWDPHTDADQWNGASTSHATGVWFDYVIDLGAIKGSTSLNGKTVTMLRLAFSCNTASYRGKNVYIDEIILNNNAASRTAEYVPGSSDVMLGDFEVDGKIPSYSDNNGDATSVMEVNTNPYSTCLNSTLKVFHAKSASSSKDWWKGFILDVDNFTVSSSEKYLHILMWTNSSKFEWNLRTSGGSDNYLGASTTHATETWFDYVLDLTSHVNKTIGDLRACLGLAESGNTAKDFYIDEIILSDSATPRTCVSTDVFTPEKEQPLMLQYFNLQGVKVERPINGCIYLVKKIYRNSDTEIVKTIFNK